MDQHIQAILDSIPQKILERGEEYYAEGRILSLEKDSDGMITAEVEGSDIYKVSILTDRRDPGVLLRLPV